MNVNDINGSKLTLNGFVLNLRADGRHRFESRSIKMKTKSIKSSFGYAQVEIGGSKLLVGTKYDFEMMSSSCFNIGEISFNLQSSPLASHESESNLVKSFTGLVKSIRFLMEVMKSEISMGATMLKSSYHSNFSSHRTTHKSIRERKPFYCLNVDFVVLHSDGAISELLSLGVQVALENIRSKITQFIYCAELKPRTGIKNINKTYRKTKIQINHINRLILITISHIGPYYILDTTLEEDYYSTTVVQFAVNILGEINGYQFLCGKKCSTDRKTFLFMQQIATSFGTQILRQISKAFNAVRD